MGKDCDTHRLGESRLGAVAVAVVGEAESELGDLIQPRSTVEADPKWDKEAGWDSAVEVEGVVAEALRWPSRRHLYCSTRRLPSAPPFSIRA